MIRYKIHLAKQTWKDGPVDPKHSTRLDEAAFSIKLFLTLIIEVMYIVVKANKKQTNWDWSMCMMTGGAGEVFDVAEIVSDN